jgi:hypothetical protein
MNIFTRAAIARLALGPLASARCDESALHLQEAPEAVTVRAYCSSCHGVDYILMNASFMKKAGSDAEAHRMMKVMRAPLPEDAAARAVDYLTNTYGAEWAPGALFGRPRLNRAAWPPCEPACRRRRRR